MFSEPTAVDTAASVKQPRNCELSEDSPLPTPTAVDTTGRDGDGECNRSRHPMQPDVRQSVCDKARTVSVGESRDSASAELVGKSRKVVASECMQKGEGGS